MFFHKKTLGQNFLRSKKALAQIIEAAELGPRDTMLEIGPGEGVLTEALLTTGTRVISVEKDDRLVPSLESKFKNEIASGKLKLIHADILDWKIENWKIENYKLVANIPYYITGQVLRKFLAGEIQPKLAVLMLQKEVAERIVARDGKQSLLSISVKAYGKPEIVAKVSKTAFTPQPKVDSAILKISNISKRFFQDLSPSLPKREGEKVFFEIIKFGFSHKRKKLLSNLKSSGYQNLEKTFERCGVSKDARAENLTLTNWGCLLSTEILKNQ